MEGMTSTTRPLRADARKNREALVTAARRHVRRNGVTTSLEAIAREAGVGPGTLYRHFPDRESLLAEVLRAESDELRDAFERVRTEVGPADRLDRWLREIEKYIANYRGLSAPIIEALDDHEPTSLSGTCRDILDLTEILLAEARAHGQVRPDVTAQDLLACASMLAWLDCRTAGTSDRHDGVRAIVHRGYR